MVGTNLKQGERTLQLMDDINLEVTLRKLRILRLSVTNSKYNKKIIFLIG